MNDAKGKPQKEPTMEEILASIRRIISDEAPAQPAEDEVLVLTENMAQAKPQAQSTPAPPASPAPMQAPPTPPSPMASAMGTDFPGTPVLPVQPAPPMMAASSAAPVMNQPMAAPQPTMPPVQPPMMQPQTAPQAAMTPPPQQGPSIRVQQMQPTSGGDSALISPRVQQGTIAALAQLQQVAKPQRNEQQQHSDGLLVEALVRSAVEPMLKNWLDEHLQTIVENTVRREIERLAKKAELG